MTDDSVERLDELIDEHTAAMRGLRQELETHERAVGELQRERRKRLSRPIAAPAAEEIG